MHVCINNTDYDRSILIDVINFDQLRVAIHDCVCMTHRTNCIISGKTAEGADKADFEAGLIKIPLPKQKRGPDGITLTSS